jgi:hypothetical protein
LASTTMINVAITVKAATTMIKASTKLIKSC